MKKRRGQRSGRQKSRPFPGWGAVLTGVGRRGGKGPFVSCRPGGQCFLSVLWVSSEVLPQQDEVMTSSDANLQLLLFSTRPVAKKTAIIHLLIMDEMTNFVYVFKPWLDDSACPVVSYLNPA